MAPAGWSTMDEAGRTAAPGGGDATSFTEGRYVYCAVDATGADGAVAGGAVVDGAVTDGESEDPAATDLSVTGVDGREPHVVTVGNVGAVVQPCESLYDSEDAATVKRWLLQHQTVIDEAGESFGTPIPFRFDTVLKGDDDAVRDWLADQADTFEELLDRLAGRWEYRIEITWDEGALRDRAAADDDDLQELEARRDEASEGTAFLVEKQYETRLRELVRDQRSRELRALVDDLDEIADELEEVDRPSTTLVDEREPAADEQQTMLTALVDETRESAVGDRLDEAASRSGVEIRFTGPWPPYSFVPELGGD